MNLASASVRRPIFATMMTLIVVVLGIMSLSRLQIDLLPSIELPTLTVRTQYEGADPIVIERLVTQIVEEIVATVPGIEAMTSQSYEGNSSVKISFGWNNDIDNVAVDVQATLTDEKNELPDEVIGPRVSKFDVDSFPVVLLGISSDLDPVELTQLVENQIRHRFARIPGVAQVDPWGGFTRQIRVELDPAKLNALGIPLNDILDRIKNANLDLPAGKIESGRFEVTLRAPSEYKSLDEISATVIAERDGAQVSLGQVAVIKDTYEKLNRLIRVDGKRGLRIAIRKQPEANTVEVAKRVLAELQEVNRVFPQLHVTPVINQGNFIERSIANVTQSVFYGGALAILVLLFFLRNVRSTVVISLSIPISMMATFALLYFGGFTLNLMTLGGLALGVGMMVDSSVVVLENIFRRFQERDEAPDQAAISGTSEVASAVIAGTVTTLTIFLPVIFLTGVTGVLFKELAYVIMFSLLCALLVALALVPMLAAKLLQHESDHQAPQWLAWISRHSGRWLAVFETFYAGTLDRALAHRWPVIITSTLLFLISLWIIPLLGSEFLPPSDEGEVRITGEMEVGTRMELLDRQTKIMEKIVFANVPEAISSVTNITTSGTKGNPKAQAEIRLSLTPATQRTQSNEEIAERLRKKLDGKIPGMKIRTRAPQGQFLLERLLATQEGIGIEVRGYDLDTLAFFAKQIAEAVTPIPGITDVGISREVGIPQIQLHALRDKIADLGLDVRDVTKAIETAVAGARAGEYRVDGNSHTILVQLADAERRSIDEILDLTLRTAEGEQVALRNVVEVSSGSGPVLIERKDQQRVITVGANIANRDLGSVATDVRKVLDAIVKPEGYQFVIAGNIEEQGKAFSEMQVSLVLALLLVYMVLASQYESLRAPLIVMLSVPMATVGVVLTLYFTGTTLNLQSAIGCIMLCGIVVNNAILLVDQAGRLRVEGMPTLAAVKEAGRLRLRPILMTTLTTILALFPLALGIGEGADAQAPLARAVLGGLTASTVITLVLIPVVYAMVFRDRAEPAYI